MRARVETGNPGLLNTRAEINGKFHIKAKVRSIQGVRDAGDRLKASAAPLKVTNKAPSFKIVGSRIKALFLKRTHLRKAPPLTARGNNTQHPLVIRRSSSELHKSPIPRKPRILVR